MAARKISFFPGDNGGEVVLGDDAAGELISGGEPAQSRVVQEFHPTRAAYARRFNRGGVVNSITWRVDRDHGTVAAAIEFLRDHAEAIPNPLGEATGYLAAVGADGSARYLQNCTIVAIRCLQFVGQSTLFEYTAVGGAWSDVVNP